MVDPADAAGLRATFQANSNDVGIGLYNPIKGEIRLGSFDTVTQRQGHQGLADALGITDNSEWRGFILTSDGKFAATSHFNRVDGGVLMRPDLANLVEQELKQAGLVN